MSNVIRPPFAVLLATNRGPGAYHYNMYSRTVQVWDGLDWYMFDESLVRSLGVRLDPAEGTLPYSTVRMLKNAVTQQKSEDERLSLRQLLAQTQKEEAMNEMLIERLRAVATLMTEWDTNVNPPLTDWADLMDEAADALEAVEEDE